MGKLPCIEISQVRGREGEGEGEREGGGGARWRMEGDVHVLYV